MKRLFLIFLILGLNAEADAQKFVFRKDVAIDSVVPKRGANRKHYVHPFLSLGLSCDAGEAGAKVQQPRLDQWNFGFRYKRRISENFALGYDIYYGVDDFRLKQEAGKKLPDTLKNNRERMIFNYFAGGLYMRINVGRRGNSLGNYLDLGGYGSATFTHTHFVKNKLPDGSVIRSRITRLDYFQLFNYGLQARIGLNKFLIYGQYRLSNMFYADKNLPELPRIQAGIQFVMR